MRRMHQQAAPTNKIIVTFVPIVFICEAILQACTCTWHSHKVVGLQDIVMPWSPAAVAIESLAAAERNSRADPVIRPALKDIKNQVLQLVQETIHGGQNCSFAVAGKHGCGKSLVCTW
jgi:hypothetical protein